MRAILVTACLAASLVVLPAEAQVAQGSGAKYLILAGKLYGQGKQQELIREMQPHLDAGEQLPVTVVWYLGYAYYLVRNYRGLLTTADIMDRSIAAGERMEGVSDNSPWPLIFRA